MEMRALTGLCIGLVLLASVGPASAQVSLSRERGYVMADGTMTVNVALPAGARVGRPRLATIRDGQALPGGGSKAWVEFRAARRLRRAALLRLFTARRAAGAGTVAPANWRW
jgi:hypothetical protein